MTDPDIQPPALPTFEVAIAAPDLSPWRTGNCGLPGVMRFTAAEPGPHVALFALTHGNEIAGAIALDKLLRAGVRPTRGTLSFVFHNLDAFDRFDPQTPTASRYCDEDLNRVWAADVLAGPRHSRELRRARALLPFVETVDVLLDLHSMLWPADPIILCGESVRGRELGLAIGTPDLVVADAGHASGRRLIDHARFIAVDGAARAVLVEAGQHWAAETVATSLAAIAGLLLRHNVVAPCAALPAVVTGASRFAEVTDTITARGDFVFLQAYRGGDVVRRRNTLIALDGTEEIRTRHDNCLLIMPSLRPSRGHTSVRLARFVPILERVGDASDPR